MKLRLPNKLQAALMAALASISFTTLSSGTLSAAFFFGSQAFAEEAADNPGATIDIGDTNLDAQAAIDEEEGKGEAKEPGSAPINQAGFNGRRGSSDDFDRQSTAEASTESSIDTENVGTADQANYTGTSADLPSNDLGFTSNPYEASSDTSNGSVVDSPVPSFTQAPQIASAGGYSAAGTGSGSSSNKTTTGAIGSIGGTGSGATGGSVARRMALTTSKLLSPVSSPSVGGTSYGGDSGSASPALATSLKVGAAGSGVPASSGDLGHIIFMGDSITNGYYDMTHRWQMFKTFVDNGVVFDIDGPLSGYTSSAMPSANSNPDFGTAYRGKAFENVHYAKSSGRSGEMISGASRYENVSIAQVGQTNYDTYALLIGTNDLLSEKGYTYDDFKTKMQNLLGGTVSYSGTGTDAEWSWTPGATPGGNLNTIVDALKLDQGDEFLMLSIPVWTTHGNNNEDTTHAAVAGYNKLLRQWVNNYNSRADAATTIKYVDVNEGILDITSSKPFFGNKAFFNNGNDGLHPSNQGSLIMAGNEARAMGIGGRTAGLHRSSAEVGKDWTTVTGSITLTEADSSQTVTGAAFTEENGYTVDFTATFGNGSKDGWLDADKDRPESGVAKVTTFSTLTNSLNITVGDGTHTGTLKLAEGYVAWDCGSANGDMVLYCQDNSVSSNEALRIAYRDADSANNILGGYYVWKGDMLIGQGLAASGGAGFDGIRVSLTGGDSTGGTVGNISWANTAYAPTTNLFSQEPLPSHDNPNPQGIKEGVAWTPTTDKFALPSGQSSTEGTIYKEISTTIGRAYTGAANANYTGNIGMHYTGTENLDAKQSILSVWNATVTGDVYILLDNPNTVYDSFTTQAGQYTSMVATWGGNITGKYTATINAGILPYNVYGGAHTGNNSHIDGGSYIYINGGQFGENVYGGGRVASATINQGTYVTVTGGAISGSVYGGGVDGTINGGSHVTITGGSIAGSVYGGGSGGTVNGGTSVTVDGNLPYIGGDIVADTVTLQNVAPDSKHADTFDKYRGNIRADKVVLDHYTVEHLLAGVETKSLVLSGGSSTTVSNLTLTACDIHVDAGSTLTLEGVNTYGNTATYNGHVAIANGTTFTLHTATMSGEASGYSDGLNGFAKGTMIVLKQTPAEDEEAVAGTGLYGTDGNTLTPTTTDTLIGGGILTGATFNYDAETGQLTAEAQGTGGPFFVNEGTVVYRAGTNVYTADDIRLNGGTLQFQETLKDGTALSVMKTGSGISLDNGVSMAVNRVDAASLAEFGVTLSGTMTASTRNELLANFSGTDANITTTANITLNNGDTTLAGGVLTIGAGLNFSLNSARDHTYNISSFKQIVLKSGSAINYWGGTVTFNNVTLADGNASISITDMANSSMLTLAGQTQLNGHRLSITAPDTSYKRFVTIAQLMGDADSTLSFEGGKTNDGSGSKLTINSLQGFSGTLELKENNTGNPLTAVVKTGSGSNVKLAGVNLAGTGEVLELTAQTALNLGTVSVANDSEIKFHGTPTQQITIEKLASNAAGKTLKVYSADQTVSAHHIVLGAADADYTSGLFNGTLWVTSNSAQGSGTASTVDVYVVAQDVLAATTLKTDNWDNNYNNTRIALSLGTDAKVAGINSANASTKGGASMGAYIRSGELSITSHTTSVDAYASTSQTAYTLEMTGTDAYTSNAYIMGKVNLAMSGSGSQTFKGDLSRFNGSINVTNGTLALTPNSSIATHAVNVGSDGTLTITTTGSNAITASATMHNEGTLNLTGTVKLDAVHMPDFVVVEGTDAPVYTGVTRDGQTYGTSGFLVTSAQYYLVKGTEGSTLTASVTIDENTGELVGQTSDPKSVIVKFKTNETGGMFYVNDSFTYGDDMNAASDISIAREKTLTAAGSGALSSSKVLHGEGTYALASDAQALNGNLSLGTDWTGAVKISGSINNLDLSAGKNLYNGQSSIILDGWTGYFKEASQDITTDVEIGEGGITLINGWAASVINFTGVLSGSGDIVRNNNADVSPDLRFSGDVSGYTGDIINKRNGSHGLRLTFSGTANEINAAEIKNNTDATGKITIDFEANDTMVDSVISKNSGTIDLTVGANTTFKRTIDASGLTVNENRSATLEQNASFASLSGAGTLAYNGENAGTVSITGNLTNFTGSLVNVSDADMEIRLNKAANTVKANIGSTGEGKVNLTLNVDQSSSFGDYFLYGTQSFHNITHQTAVTLEVRENGNVTATGKVVTGRLVVGNASTDTGAVFTLSGAQARLTTADTHTYENVVQGYGTFEVADGATQTLSNLNAGDNAFHGTLKATGTNSTLTLNSTLGSGTDLVTEDGGKIVLTSNVTSVDAVTVDGSSTLTLSGASTPLSATGTFSLASGSTLDLSNYTFTGTESSVALVTTISSGTISGPTDWASVNLTFADPSMAEKASLGVDGNNLVLTFAQPEPGKDLIWDGTSSTWASGSSEHWHEEGSSALVSFTNNDNAIFDSASSAVTVTMSGEVTAGTMMVKSGAKVTIGTGEGNTLTVANGITIEQGGILAQTGTGLSGTLQGAGIYALASSSNTLPSGVTLDPDNWTGSVEVSGKVTGPASFNALATGKSSVLASGVSYWSQPNGTQAANFILNGNNKDNGQSGDANTAAMQINAADNGATYNFSGTMSGAGDFAYTQTAGRTATFKFQGDVSQWTGDIVNYNTANSVTYQIDRSGDVTFNGGFVQRAASGTMDVKLGNTNNTAATVNGAVAVRSAAMRFRLANSSAKVVNLTDVTIDNNAKLQALFSTFEGTEAFNLTNVTMSGENATIGSSSDGHGGQINITKVTGSGTLNLESNATSSARALISLGTVADPQTPTFSGTIAAKLVNNGSQRAMVTVLKGEYTAASSVVQLDVSGNQANRAFGFGIAAANTRVLGLNDSGTPVGSLNSNALFSGDGAQLLVNCKDVVSTYLDNASDAAMRTLMMMGSGAYSTSIRVLNNVSMVMDGTGSQGFTGDLSRMNGAVVATAGKLVLNNSGATPGSLSSVSVSGGTLELGNMNVTGATTVSSGTLSTLSGITFTGDVSVAGGATLKLASMDANAITSSGTFTMGSGTTLDLSGLALGGGAQTVTLVKGGDITDTYLNDVSVYFGAGIKVNDYALSVNGRDLVLTVTMPDVFVWGDHAGTGKWTPSKNWHTVSTPDSYVEFAMDGIAQFETAATVALTENTTAGQVRILNGSSVTINTDGHRLTTEVLQGGGATLDKTGAGTLAIENGVTLEKLRVTGGTVRVNAEVGSDSTVGQVTGTSGGTTLELYNTDANITGSQSLQGNLIIGGGSTVKVDQVDSLKYSGNSSKISVQEGGELSFDNKRWSVGGATTIELAGGLISGAGEGSNGALDYHENNVNAGKITAIANTSSVISAAVRFRENNTVVTFDVADGADLTLSGLLNGNGSLKKAGAGELIVSHANTYKGSTTVGAGTMVADHSAAFSTGAVSVADGAELVLTTKVDSLANNITMASGSTLTLSEYATNAVDLTGTVTLRSGMTLNLSGISGITGYEKTPVTLLTTSTGSITADDLASIQLVFSSSVDEDGTLGLNSAGDLVLSFSPSDLVWNGTDGTWSTTVSEANWYLADGYPTVKTASAFENGKTVMFDSASDGKTVTLGSNVSTPRVKVSDTSVTIDAAASALAMTDLLVNRAGELILEAADGGSVSLTNNATVAEGSRLVIADASLANVLAKTDGIAGTAVVGNGTDSVEITLDKKQYTAADIEVADKAVLNIRWHNSGTANVANTLTVKGGGRVNFTAGDSLGWGNNGTKKIVLAGDPAVDETAANLAVMDVTGKQTMSTVLEMQGNALVSGSGALEIFNDGNATGKIVATGTNNTIESEVRLRSATSEISVGEAGALIISGNVVNGESGANAKLTKTGTGALTLSGNNTYTGGTVVSAGILTAASQNALGTGAVTVNQGATLEFFAAVGSNPATVGSLTANSGATVMLSGINNDAIGTTGTFTLASGSILDLTKLDDIINVDSTEAITLVGKGTNGSITADYLDNVTLSFLHKPSREAQLDLSDDGDLILRFVDTLTWDDSTTSGLWNTSDTNWHMGNATASHYSFKNHDNVRFNTTDTAKLSEDIVASAMTITGSKTVTINENGHQLLADSVTGASATLQVTDTAESGDGVLVIAKDAMLRNLKVNTGGQAEIQGDAAIGSTINVASAGTLAIDGTTTAATVTVDGEGSAATLKGDATVTNMNIQNGGSVETRGTTLLQKLAVTGGGALVNTGTLKLNGSNKATISGTASISGNGRMEVSGIQLSNNTELTIGGGQVVDLFSTTGITGGKGDSTTLKLGDATLVADSSSWAIANTVDSVVLTDAVNGTKFSAVDHTLTVQAGITGTGKLVKEGNGILELSGDNGYTGGTQVNAGTLLVSSAQALSGNVSVAQNATLTFSPGLEGATVGDLMMASGSTLRLGGEGMLTTTGTITMVDGAILDVSALSFTTAQTTYTLATGGSFNLTPGAVTLNFERGEHPKAGTSPYLKIVSGEGGVQQLELHYEINEPTGLIWNGGEEEWDVGNTAHWHGEEAPEISTAFNTFDNVTFANPGEGMEPSVALVTADVWATHMTIKEGTDAAHKNVVEYNVAGGKTLNVDFVDAEDNTGIVKSGAGTFSIGVKERAFAADMTVADGKLIAQYVDMEADAHDMLVTGSLLHGTDMSKGITEIVVGDGNHATNLVFDSTTEISAVSRVETKANGNVEFNGDTTITQVAGQHSVIHAADGTRISFNGTTYISDNNMVFEGAGEIYFGASTTMDQQSGHNQKINDSVSVTFETFSLNDYVTFILDEDTSLHIKNLSLTRSDKTQIFYVGNWKRNGETNRQYVTIDTVTVDGRGGSKAIGSISSSYTGSSDNQECGSFYVDKLQCVKDSETGENISAVFELSNRAVSSHPGFDIPEVLYLGGSGTSDFTGTIRISDCQGASAYAGTASNRKDTVLILQDETVSANAVVDVLSKGQYNDFGVGVAADNVKVLGITGESLPGDNKFKLFSGSMGSKLDDTYQSDDTVRTLELTGSGDYKSCASIDKNLNLKKTGEGTQVFTGDSSKFDASINVQGGVLEFQNNLTLTAEDLIIAAEKQLKVLSGAQDSAARGTVTVHGTLLAQGGSTKNVPPMVKSALKAAPKLTLGEEPAAESGASKLDANLSLAAGSKLDISAAGGVGGLDLCGNSLTLQPGAMLSSADLSNIYKLEWGDAYDLAFNVSSLTMGDTTYTDPIEWDTISADTYFTNLKQDDYYICYTGAGSGQSAGGNVGTFYILKLPEPTTGTLSLLALAALAARRRRK